MSNCQIVYFNLPCKTLEGPVLQFPVGNVSPPKVRHETWWNWTLRNNKAGRTKDKGVQWRGIRKDLHTVYSPFEFISLVFSTSRGWHKNVAQPPWKWADGDKQRKELCEHYTLTEPLRTHSNEAGNKVCQDIISHNSRPQHKLFGLVVARQLNVWTELKRHIFILSVWYHYFMMWAFIRHGPWGVTSSFTVF